jgi:hypothetical protein
MRRRTRRTKREIAQPNQPPPSQAVTTRPLYCPPSWLQLLILGTPIPPFWGLSARLSRYFRRVFRASATGICMRLQLPQNKWRPLAPPSNQAFQRQSGARIPTNLFCGNRSSRVPNAPAAHCLTLRANNSACCSATRRSETNEKKT